MGGLLLASHPEPVREAIERHRQGLDDNPVHYLHDQGPRLEWAVLHQAASYLGTAASDIALTDSTTMGLGLVYNGVAVRADEEILTTTHDFYATHEALRLKAEATGAHIRRVSLYDDPASANPDVIVERLGAAVTDRTRVVAVTWVHSSTGVKLPIRRLSDIVAAANIGRAPRERALLCVDGVHGLGVDELTASELGCDVFVAGCHKWLFGPRGTGIVWANPSAWPEITPTIPSFGAGSSYGSLMTPGGFHSFEHRWALAEGFGFHRAIGKERVWDRIRELNSQLKDGLAGMPHVTVHTPRDPMLSAGLVCFEVRGMGPDHVVDRLRQRQIIATVTPYARRLARLAPGLLNSPEEVDVVLSAIRGMA